jgi:hypothetical protein
MLSSHHCLCWKLHSPKRKCSPSDRITTPSRAPQRLNRTRTRMYRKRRMSPKLMMMSKRGDTSYETGTHTLLLHVPLLYTRYTSGRLRRIGLEAANTFYRNQINFPPWQTAFAHQMPSILRFTKSPDSRVSGSLSLQAAL